MATNTNINFPQSEFLDPLTKRPAREWMLWLMSPSVIALNSKTALSVQSGGTGLSTTPTDGQLLIGNGINYTLDTLTPGLGISVTNASGSITVANTGVLSWSAGITGLTPATATTGNVTLSGLLKVASGGTGQSSYTDGQLLIGNSTGNTLGKNTLTSGVGITITNAPAAITIQSNQSFVEAYDLSASIAITATPILLAPANTAPGARGITYNSSTGVFTFAYEGSYSLSLVVNAISSAANQFLYIWSENWNGSTWVANANSGKYLELLNNQITQIISAQAVYRLAGQQVRYWIYSNSNKIQLQTLTLPGIAATVYTPAIRIQYS